MMASDSGSTVMIEKEFPKSEKRKTNFDVIIIGGGPAGYTSGIYCSRARHETLIFNWSTSRWAVGQHYRGGELSRIRARGNGP